VILGLPEEETRCGIRAFYDAAAAPPARRLSSVAAPTGARIYEVMIAPWERDILGEGFAEDRDGISFYHPRRVRRMAELLTARIARDFANPRFAPSIPDDVAYVKRQLARTF